MAMAIATRCQTPSVPVTPLAALLAVEVAVAPVLEAPEPVAELAPEAALPAPPDKLELGERTAPVAELSTDPSDDASPETDDAPPLQLVRLRWEYTEVLR